MHFQNPDRKQNVVTCNSEFYAERSVQIVYLFLKLYSFQNWILHKFISKPIGKISLDYTLIFNISGQEIKIRIKPSSKDIKS